MNNQTTLSSTGGGTGHVTAANNNAGTVNDTGVASGTTGFSAAEGAPASASLGPGAGPSVQNASNTTATSGNATAQGLQAQNSVINNSLGIGQVGGGSTQPVSVTSNTQVNVTNTGIGTVNTGQALAKGGSADVTQGSTVTGSWGTTGAGAGGSLGTTNLTGGSAPTGSTTTVQSASVTAVGTAVQNSVSSTLNTALTSNGHDGPINLNQTQSVNLSTTGQANATTASVSAAPTPPPTGATTAPTASSLNQVVSVQNQSNTSATSGDASAMGAQVQNSVTTNANAQVHVGGANFAPIQIIINNITNILNLGNASATTGTSKATGAQASVNTTTTNPSGPGAGSGASGTGGVNNTTSATSGSAQATGATVSNNVQLGSSTQVTVNGDNHNPIDIVVHMMASIFNWGSATATTGNAQATGAPAISSGSGTNGVVNNASNTTAATGNAGSLGLLAQNAVNMWAWANVDITGSNYAPITLMIMFETDIQNLGQAQSATGDPTAQGAAAMVGSSGGGSSGGNANGAAANPTGAAVNQSPSQTSSQTYGSTGSTGAGGTGTTSSAGTSSGGGIGSSNTNATSGGLHLYAGPTYNGAAPSGSSTSGGSTGGSATSTTTYSSSYTGSFSNSSDTSSSSGNGQAVGLVSQFSAVSNQVAVAHNPAGKQYTTQSNNNSYTYNTTGVASFKTGDVLSGPTPTPTPVPPTTTQPGMGWGTQPGTGTANNGGAANGGVTSSWPSGASVSDTGSGAWGAGLSKGNGGLSSIVQGSQIVQVNMFQQWPSGVTQPVPSQSTLLDWPAGGFSGGTWPGGPGASSDSVSGRGSGLAGSYANGVFTRPGTDVYGTVGDVDPLSGRIVPAGLPMPQDLVPSRSVTSSTGRSWWSLAPTYPGRSRLDLVVSELLLAIACAALVWMKMERSEHRFVWLRGVVQYGLGLFVLLFAVLWRK